MPQRLLRYNVLVRCELKSPVLSCVWHMLNNRGAILVLVGAFEEALNTLHTQLEQNPRHSWLRFTLATCLLHLERYQEAVVAYEQVIAEDGHLQNDAGLVAARQGQQPDWTNL